MKTFFSSPKKVAAAALAVILVVSGLVFATSKVNASNSQNRGIGLEKSVSVALNDAGFQQDQVSNLKATFDHDDGIEVYDVYFVANGYEYEYTIKAADGSILESQIESPDGNQVTPSEAKDIGLDKVKQLVLKHAGFKESEVDFTKTKQSKEDGRLVYEIEFFKGNTEYDYEVDAATGDIIEHSQETQQNASVNSTGGSNNTGTQPSSNYIGVDKAKSLALKNAGVKASDATFTKAKLDRDDGMYLYDIEFFAGEIEYEYEINALTGDILEWDSERMELYDDDWDD